MEFWCAILRDSIESAWDDIIDAPLEQVGLAIQQLFTALIDEYDMGERRAILYDIATAAIIAAQSTYSEE